MYSWPVDPHPISDTFADHVARGSVNPGVDFPVPVGTPVHSVASGTVTVADDNPGGSGGKMVHVNHDDGTGADYLHLSGVSVHVGQTVAQGALLGYSGNTGTETTGPHLHMSFRPNHTDWFGNVGNEDFAALMTGQTAPASGTGTPLPAPLPAPTPIRKTAMKFYSDKAGTIYYGAYAIPGNKDGIPGTTRLAVLKRYDGGVNTTFNAVEVGWIREALAANGFHA